MEFLKREQAFDQVEVLSGQETISAYMIDGKLDNESEDAGQVEGGNTEVITKTQEIDKDLRKVWRQNSNLICYFILVIFISSDSPFSVFQREYIPLLLNFDLPCASS